MSVSRRDGCFSVNCLKNFSVAVYIISLIVGGFALSVGYRVVAEKDYFISLLDSIDTQLIVACVFVSGHIILTVVGLFATVRETRSVLLMYIVSITLFFLFGLIWLIVMFSLRGQLWEKLKIEMNTTITVNYAVDKEATTAIDNLQELYKCCGACSFEDWEYSEWHRKEIEQNVTSVVPESCCINPSTHCASLDINLLRNLSQIYTEGCTKPLINKHLWVKFRALGIVGFGILFLELLSIILSIRFYTKSRNFEKITYVPTRVVNGIFRF